MTLTAFEWTVIGIVFSGLLGIASYFIKRVHDKTDKNTEDIQGIRETYITKKDFEKSSQTCKSHNGDINEIKRTYVTKTELKELKTELRDETQKLTADISEIKANYLTKDDFYRTQSETNKKLDDIYKLLLRGGGNLDGER